MNRDFDSISIQDISSNRAMIVDFGSPENKRDIPCDVCPNKQKCKQQVLECAAFRNWASKGDFADKDVGRLLRAI